MIIVAPKEPHDSRSALVPEMVRKLKALEGGEVVVETGLSSHFSDDAFKEAGAVVEADRAKIYSRADVVLRLNPSTPEEVAWMKSGSLHISFLDPYNNRELVEKYAGLGISALSMEMIPRTTLAQKMDAISSQASLAGYVAVLKAAERLSTVIPMMMTPAGTLSPARIFVIGAGVAGLQAIATARRLGGRVEAFDTRPVVEEQVQSLGAKFVKVDLGETGQTKDGYAKALTEEQLLKQREVMAKHCALSDIVITTAKIFGRKAPIIITADMVKGMKPGSVVVDLAAGSGGNVAGTVVDQEVLVNGVRIIGMDNLAGEVATHASLLYAGNQVNLLTHFWDAEKKGLSLNINDEILAGSLVVHNGEIIHPAIKKFYEGVL